MEFKTLKISVLIIILLFPFLIFAQVSFWNPTPHDELLKSIISRMSDEELLGQVLLLGYSGTQPDSAILDWIRHKQIGGVKIFGWNVKSLDALVSGINKMQHASQTTRFRIPLIIATDQEGGWVRHIKFGTSQTAGNLALGAAGIPYDAYYAGYYIGQELSALGINMNFAPTVDVYTNPNAHVIGPRAFSSDPLQTALLATAFFKGMKKSAIISTAKHYPGHGNTDKDSHGTLPVIPDDFDTLWKRDLLPYRFLIKEGLPAIMSGHLAFPKVLGNNTPATLSRFFITTVLKEKMNFQGMVVTDDLRMHGVTDTGMDIPDICVTALEAGNDFLLISRGPGTYQRIWEKILGRVKADPQFRMRVKDAATRVLSTKINYLKASPAGPLIRDNSTSARKIPSPMASRFFFDQACRSVTLIRSHSIPLKPAQGKKILLLGQFQQFFQEGTKRFPQAEIRKFSHYPFFTPSETDLKMVKAVKDRYDIIIFCLGNPSSVKLLKELRHSKADVIVFSVLSPIYLRETPWIKSALAVYGTSIGSFEAGFGALAGDFPAQGTLPLSLIPDTE